VHSLARGSDLKSNEGVGDCPFSWAADGDRQLKWHLAHTGLWGGKWTEGDMIGIACDLNSRELSWCVLAARISTASLMQSLRSVNGWFEAPNGAAFAGDEAPDISSVVYAALETSLDAMSQSQYRGFTRTFCRHPAVSGQGLIIRLNLGQSVGALLFCMRAAAVDTLQLQPLRHLPAAFRPACDYASQ
jgi:hypothetical protein